MCGFIEVLYYFLFNTKHLKKVDIEESYETKYIQNEIDQTYYASVYDY